jgi:hypothetical protein
LLYRQRRRESVARQLAVLDGPRYPRSAMLLLG